MHGKIWSHFGFYLKATKEYLGHKICQLPVLEMSKTSFLNKPVQNAYSIKVFNIFR